MVAGDQRGGTLGFPTANLAPEPHMLIPAFGIYVGEALGTRAAVSIGVNPHYGGNERRIEAFLLDFEGDLYGERVRLELWEKLRDERAFASEEDLVAQIAEDVAAARAATRPAHDIRCKFSRPRAALSLYGCRSPLHSLPRLRVGLPRSGRRGNRDAERGLPALRLRRLGTDRADVHGSSRAAPLLLGSAAAPARATALTPPK